MAYVIAAPEMMTAAATDLATIASNVSAAHLVAAAPTVAVIPAAADEVSAGMAHLFSQYASGFQALAGKATAFHEQFVHTLKSGAFSYTSTEAAIASLLRPLNVSADSFVRTPAATIPPFQTLFIQSVENFIRSSPQDAILFWLTFPFSLIYLALIDALTYYFVLFAMI